MHRPLCPGGIHERSRLGVDRGHCNAAHRHCHQRCCSRNACVHHHRANRNMRCKCNGHWCLQSRCHLDCYRWRHYALWSLHSIWSRNRNLHRPLCPGGIHERSRLGVDRGHCNAAHRHCHQRCCSRNACVHHHRANRNMRCKCNGHWCLQSRCHLDCYRWRHYALWSLHSIWSRNRNLHRPLCPGGIHERSRLGVDRDHCNAAHRHCHQRCCSRNACVHHHRANRNLRCKCNGHWCLQPRCHLDSYRRHDHARRSFHAIWCRYWNLHRQLCTSGIHKHIWFSADHCYCLVAHRHCHQRCRSRIACFHLHRANRDLRCDCDRHWSLQLRGYLDSHRRHDHTLRSIHTIRCRYRNLHRPLCAGGIHERVRLGVDRGHCNAAHRHCHQRCCS